jgi:hypothetical protein
METLLSAPGIFALLLGVVLLLISLVGGELEIKEIKIPKLQKTARIIISITGLFLVGGGCLLSAGGVYLAIMSKNANAAKEVPQTAPQKIEIHIDSSKIDQQLPTAAGIPNDVRQSIVDLVVNADLAEINGVYYKDNSYLTPYYSGNALLQMEKEVANASATSEIILLDFIQDKSYYLNFRQLDSNTYSFDGCEYWVTYYYDGDNGNLITAEPEELNPQTITIEDQDGQYYVTAITNYTGSVFCDR